MVSILKHIYQSPLHSNIAALSTHILFFYYDIKFIIKLVVLNLVSFSHKLVLEHH